eukprot:scaffold2888_cov274-Pinguiococcus_pyrenoidosus.AAC.10
MSRAAAIPLCNLPTMPCLPTGVYQTVSSLAPQKSDQYKSIQSYTVPDARQVNSSKELVGVYTT